MIATELPKTRVTWKRITQAEIDEDHATRELPGGRHYVGPWTPYSESVNGVHRW